MGIPYGQARRSIQEGDDWVNVLTGQVVAMLDSGELLLGWAPQTALQRFADRTGAYIAPDLMDDVLVTRWAETPADVAALASDAASMVALGPGWARGSDRAKAAIRGLRTAMDPTGRSMRVETPVGTFGAEVCDDDSSKPIDLYVYLEREGCEPARVAAVDVGRDGAIGGYFLEDTLERVPSSRVPSADPADFAYDEAVERLRSAFGPDIGVRAALESRRDPLDLLCWIDAQSSAPYSIGIVDDAHEFGSPGASYSFETYDYPWEVVHADDIGNGVWEGFLGDGPDRAGRILAAATAMVVCSAMTCAGLPADKVRHWVLSNEHLSHDLALVDLITRDAITGPSCLLCPQDEPTR